jgi:hypothetical protein
MVTVIAELVWRHFVIRRAERPSMCCSLMMYLVRAWLTE